MSDNYNWQDRLVRPKEAAKIMGISLTTFWGLDEVERSQKASPSPGVPRAGFYRPSWDGRGNARKVLAQGIDAN